MIFDQGTADSPSFQVMGVSDWQFGTLPPAASGTIGQGSILNIKFIKGSNKQVDTGILSSYPLQ